MEVKAAGVGRNWEERAGCSSNHLGEERGVQ